ncbi:uncharacterized protein EI90DRAFT_3281311 [Cantharellus anzutake]|uniref:uncharacterized protein n=1 Tax=Cantharellus anzutake TaxID=1750568 RepID=UPI0019080324|nr:uncharacterized protein EI90DRAFT_3281311 [Cantharellus anzutake]KAF8328355.1 hypothetical protein EI90DRAFT_3281311 [Cantharellus anzutake]
MPSSTKATKQLRESYGSSLPYKHAVIGALFDPDLLRAAQKEIIKGLNFSEKETDIYKVFQTGDLASLSYLTHAQLSLFPNLLKLRDALYSSTFRKFLQQVTGCGSLSGVKQDMSINSYRSGCHLLNHDDVIGTRRVSYILYMPIQNDHEIEWDPSWGGALEFYPVKSIGMSFEPEPSPSRALPPSWNQFVFFEVQPGHSFHSVEEVVVGGPNDSRQRLSVSGWYHAPQFGEEGFEDNDDKDVRQKQSSLSQLSSSVTGDLVDYSADLGSTAEELGPVEIQELSAFLNPAYLLPSTLNALHQKFTADSSIQLVDFLKEDIARTLCDALRNEDQTDGLGYSRTRRIPTHISGLATRRWKIKGPPHKHRFCVLDHNSSSQISTASSTLYKLETGLFTSPAFRKWLHIISSYTPTKYFTQARRFRPGLDYTLARSSDEEPRLDAILGLTPPFVEGKTNQWEEGQWGGWECYMAPHEGEDDPAVYRSGSMRSHPGTGEVEEDGEGTLLTVQAQFNRLLLVLRDEGVLRFVKYVSAAAPGSRWDICGEYSVDTFGEADGV